MQPKEILLCHRSRTLDHLGHLRVAACDRLAFLVRECLHMEQQRLLDLGRIEQAPLAGASELGMVGEDDRRAEHRVVG